MISDRWLKVGTVFGIIACVAFAAACGGGGSGGSAADSGDTTVAMSVDVAYPTVSTKALGGALKGANSEGTVTIKALSGTPYTATYTANSLVEAGGLDTCTFTANVPEGVTLLVAAERTALGGGGAYQERVELIIPVSAAGTRNVDIDSTKVAAVVKKKAENAGETLLTIDQAAIVESVLAANTMLAVNLTTYDFSAMDAAELQKFAVEYAITLAIAALAEVNAGAWDDAYDENYADITSALIAIKINDNNTSGAINTALTDDGIDATAAVAAVTALTSDSTTIVSEFTFDDEDVGGDVIADDTSGTYATRVAYYKTAYGKSDEWSTWMIANEARYTLAFAAASAKPAIITISFQYETPSSYVADWATEADHMSALATMAEGAYSGYDFTFEFGGSTSTSYANIHAGIPTNASYADGKDVYLYYETIFNHEFAHVMKIPHHYDTEAAYGDGQHMPPGETTCLMDRTDYLFCSACKTALGIPLDITDDTAVDAAITDILSRSHY